MFWGTGHGPRMPGIISSPMSTCLAKKNSIFSVFFLCIFALCRDSTFIFFPYQGPPCIFLEVELSRIYPGPRWPRPRRTLANVLFRFSPPILSSTTPQDVLWGPRWTMWRCVPQGLTISNPAQSFVWRLLTGIIWNDLTHDPHTAQLWNSRSDKSSRSAVQPFGTLPGFTLPFFLPDRK